MATPGLILYGELAWVLVVVDGWMKAAGITEGTLRSGRLSVRTIRYIVSRYPVAVEGGMVRVACHDLRRTYAGWLHDAGMDVVAIQQDLRHADTKTALGYISDLDASRRRASQIHSFVLNVWPSQGKRGDLAPMESQ